MAENLGKEPRKEPGKDLPIHYKKTLDNLLLKALPELRKVYAQTWFELVRPDQKLERRRLAKNKLQAQIKAHQDSLAALELLAKDAPYHQKPRIKTYKRVVKPLIQASERMLSLSPYTVSQTKELAPENVGAVSKAIDIKKVSEKVAKKEAAKKEQEKRSKRDKRY